MAADDAKVLQYNDKRHIGCNYSPERAEMCCLCMNSDRRTNLAVIDSMLPARICHV